MKSRAPKKPVYSTVNDLIKALGKLPGDLKVMTPGFDEGGLAPVIVEMRKYVEQPYGNEEVYVGHDYKNGLDYVHLSWS